MEPKFNVGDTVYVGSGVERIGKIAYIGETQFSGGQWVGVVLSSPLGKNDGSVNGISYFKCQPLHGIFSKPQNLRLAEDPSQAFTPDGDQFCDINSARGSTSNEIPKSSSSSVFVRAPGNQNADFKLGDRVQVSGGRLGTLRYLGPTDFANGEWAGVELDEPVGKNDGSVGGKRYFTCKPNFGLFSAVSKLATPGSQNFSTLHHRRSQESLVSYCSNISSVSRAYRAQCTPAGQGRMNSSANLRLKSSQNISDQKEQLANIQSLQRLVREKEEHINQLLEERDIERSDLARITLDREQAYSELNSQRTQIERLNQQVQNVEAANRILQEEHEQLLARLHEEKKALEDLQFRMEEENINKSSLESTNPDDESKIFELEEALMFARETNERTEAELARVREQLSALLAGKSFPVTHESKSTGMYVQQSVSSIQTSDTTLPHVQKQVQTVLKGNELEDIVDRITPETKDAKVGSPSKKSLHHVSLVTQTSIPPSPSTLDPSTQAELERLRRDLADREKITESALKRQADVLEVVSADYEKQLSDLKAQLLSASKELVISRQECTSLKDRMQSSTIELNNKIEELKKRFTEEEAKSAEKITCYANRISDLTAELEREKGKTSSTIMEQALALRKLDEKLKATERQLLEFQTQFAPGEQVNIAALIESKDRLINELQSRTNDQANELKSQHEKFSALRSLHDSVVSTRNNFEERIRYLESTLATSQSELLEAQHKQDDLVQSLDVANAVRDRLLTELSSLLGDLPENGTYSVEDLTNCLRCRIDRLSQLVSESESNRLLLENQVFEVEQKRTDLVKEFSLLKSSLSSNEAERDSQALSAQLNSAHQKISCLEASVASALLNVDSKAAELQSVKAQLDQALLENSTLRKSHMETVAMLESEKRGLLQRVQSLEASGNHSTGSGPAASTLQLSCLLEEKANAESQINFLNSIIVDLHHKNSDLEEHVRSLQANVNGPPRKPNVSAPVHRPPRRWCDNCLVFDSHDTESCPSGRVGNNHAKPPKHKLSGQSCLSSERLYCDICGIFDHHATATCTNNDTF